ncbi:hypothetical protein B0H14DRAFT_2591316 [Mycena olivaceomarginata]|nr:hypothetical protein B0H14DRAFT_2591316 [Mycena olivaceomarginata]
MNRDSGLITQFTEDQPSNVVTFCDRLRCKAPIAPGEKRHYITGYNSEEGKFVCDKWNEAGASISESQVQDIRRDVNAGRKKGAPLSVRQVTAIGNIDGSAGHPQFMLPPLQSHSGGLCFLHLSACLDTAQLILSIAQITSCGVPEAYQSVLEDFITVKYKVLREVPGKDKGVYWSGGPSCEPPHVPYFYARCLTVKPRGKDGAPTFKKPTKPFELGLYIDFDQWEGIERYLTQKEIDKEASSSLNPTTNLKPSPLQLQLSVEFSKFREYYSFNGLYYSSNYHCFELKPFPGVLAKSHRNVPVLQVDELEVPTNQLTFDSLVLSYFHHSSSFQKACHSDLPVSEP